MRSRKGSISVDMPFVLALAGHAAMGAAIGLGFSLVLILFDRFGLRPLIMHSVDPRWTAVVFAGAMMLVFAVGASLSGFVLLMMDKHRRSADQ